MTLSCLLGLVFGLTIEIASYLPFDPEWTLDATFPLFVSGFVIGAAGFYVWAPALIRFRQWPALLPKWVRWVAIAGVAVTAFWFVVLLTLPGVPTHCGTIGQPACGHEYVFNNHGSLIVTDRAHFLAGVRVLVRVFAAYPVIVFASMLVAGILTGNGRLNTTIKVRRPWFSRPA